MARAFIPPVQVMSEKGRVICSESPKGSKFIALCTVPVQILQQPLYMFLAHD